MGYSGSPGTFAGEVEAAIDAKFGEAPSGSGNAMPLSDAPLFELLLSSRRRAGEAHIDKVLPPRRLADQLLHTFWRCIHPVDFLLNKERFCRSYNRLFAGDELETEEHIFIATLNIVFAFATQVHEPATAAERNQVAATYFQRAWNLLRPESILWESPSLQLVECLLLMSRYLQCTNNPHQTWMAVGSAIRIAQSLGIHIPKTPEADMSSDESCWSYHLWNCCVFADLSISWVQGRTTMASLVSQPSTGTRPLFGESLIETLELHEITRSALQAQTPASGGFAERFGLHGTHVKKESYCSVVLHHESCLNQWERTRLNVSPEEEGDHHDWQTRRLILQIRLLHSRIILFRPMVARCCFMEQNPLVAAETQFESSYKGHMIQHGASQCIEYARKMILLIDENSKATEPSYMLPWWHRIFYLHVAVTILLAAMQSATLFTEAASDTWRQALSAFKRHEHLSAYVTHCLSLFQSLSEKASYIRHPLGHTDVPGGLSDAQFHDTFGDFGFHTDSFLFDDADESLFHMFPSG
ncbi:hypothetical protein V8C26DRAFT_412227 [Trichoderma gracile]